MEHYKPIKADTALNKKPLVGGLISEDAFGPLLGIFTICVLLGLFGLAFHWCLGLFIWFGAGWLIFAGRTPYIHVAKLTKKAPKWFSSRSRYQPQESIRKRKQYHGNFN